MKTEKKIKSVSLNKLDKIIAKKMIRDIKEQRNILLEKGEAEHFSKRKKQILKIVNKK